MSSFRWVVAFLMTVSTARYPDVVQPDARPGQVKHVIVILNGIKVRVTLNQADQMRREVVDRLAGASRPEVVELRQELVAAEPQLDRNGELHYGRWSLSGSGTVLHLSAAFPASGPFDLRAMGQPGLYATFERRAGQWRLIDVDEASTTR